MPKTPKITSSKAARAAARLPLHLRGPQAYPANRNTTRPSSTAVVYGGENPFPDTSDFQIQKDSSDIYPTNLDDDHVTDLRDFAKDLNQSLEGAFPARSCPFTSVHVLLLQWESDDLGVRKEIVQLVQVFQDQFNFEVETWEIPDSNSFHALQDKIYLFQKAHQNETELLIVYYGGHAADTKQGCSKWHAKCSSPDPFLNWSQIQPLLQTAKPSVLIILDCCYAANAVRDTTDGSSKEILAACARENQTSGVDPQSFTSVLVEELRNYDQASFTVSMLYSRLMTMRGKLKSTPIYVPLSEIGGSSITLCPVPKELQPFAHELPCPKMSLKPSNGQEEVLSTSPSQTKAFLPPTPSLPSQRSEPRVLLSISISQEIKHSKAKWVSWLTKDPPWDITKVKVQVEGWNRLRKRSAYRFIGIITSEDILANDEQVTLSRMVTRSQKRKANNCQSYSGLTEQPLSENATCFPEFRSGTRSDPMTPPPSTLNKTTGTGRPPKRMSNVTPCRPKRPRLSNSWSSTHLAVAATDSGYCPTSDLQSSEGQNLSNQNSLSGMDGQTTSLPDTPTQDFSPLDHKSATAIRRGAI